MNCEFRSRVLTIAEKQGVRVTPRLLATREDWLQSAIAHNLGVSFIPEHSVVERSLKCAKVEGIDLKRTISFVSIFGSSVSASTKITRKLACDFEWPESCA